MSGGIMFHESTTDFAAAMDRHIAEHRAAVERERMFALVVGIARRIAALAVWPYDPRRVLGWTRRRWTRARRAWNRERRRFPPRTLVAICAEIDREMTLAILRAAHEEDTMDYRVKRARLIEERIDAKPLASSLPYAMIWPPPVPGESYRDRSVLRRVTRAAVRGLDALALVDEASAADVVAPVRAALAEIGLAAGCHVGRTAMTPTETVEWYAGQVVQTVDARAWHAVNALVNTLEKFCPPKEER